MVVARTMNGVGAIMRDEKANILVVSGRALARRDVLHCRSAAYSSGAWFGVPRSGENYLRS
jgi:hypothetical protein